MRILATAAFLALGMGAAHADVVLSAPAYGGPTQSVVVCFYSVPAGQSVNFTRSVIIREPNTEVTEVSETCGGTVVSRCRTVAENVATNAVHWCEATINNKARIRGRAEYRNSSGGILTSEEIR